eukprot:6322733-Prymnesium_polylepis.1
MATSPSVDGNRPLGRVGRVRGRRGRTRPAGASAGPQRPDRREIRVGRTGGAHARCVGRPFCCVQGLRRPFTLCGAPLPNMA